MTGVQTCALPISQKLEWETLSDMGNIWDYGWNSFYEFFEKIWLNLWNASKNLNTFRLMLKWGVYDMIQLENVCIVSSLPTKILRDDKGRLHGVEEPAVQRWDGYYNTFIHGVSFSYEERHNFKDGKYSAKEILNRKNQDQKRAMMNVYGNKKLVEDAEAEVLDTSIDGEWYEMRLLRIKDDTEDMYFYEAMDNSKVEKVVLRVAPIVKTAKEAKIRTRKFLREKYQETKQEPEFIKET